VYKTPAHRESLLPAANPSTPMQLLAEASRLAREEVPRAQRTIVSLAPHVEESLYEHVASSANERTKALCAGAAEKHGRLVVEAEGLSAGAGAITTRFLRGEASYRAKLEEVFARRARVDPAKLADEELLAECERVSQSVEETLLDAWALRVSSVQIPLFLLVFSHADVLRAFLGKKSAFGQALDGMRQLGGAALIDLAGTAIPWLGVIQTALELMRPQIEREIERMSAAIEYIDRLFGLDDQLNVLLEYASYTGVLVETADLSLAAAQGAFERDADWLIEVFAVIARK
jgi:hypothetical protein